MNVVNFDALDLGERLGRGGQGAVHFVHNQQINQRWAVAYKEYLPSVLPTVRIDALRQMVDLAPLLPLDDGTWLTEETSWPAALVDKGGQISGFLMRAVPEDFRFAFQTLGVNGASRKLANVEFLLNDDAYVAGIGLRVSERDRLLFLAALAETLDRFHSLDIAVGDLSPKNLLFSIEPKVKCFVIDCDAMRLRGASVTEQVETPGWQVPQGEEKATRHSDAYKFGLLAIRLFARQQESMDPDALAQVSVVLGSLACDSVSPNVEQRPPPAAWIDELKTTAAKASNHHAVATVPQQTPGSNIFISADTLQAQRASFTFGPVPAAGPSTPRGSGASVSTASSRHVGLGRAPSGKLVALVVIALMISMLIMLI